MTSILLFDESNGWREKIPKTSWEIGRHYQYGRSIMGRYGKSFAELEYNSSGGEVSQAITDTSDRYKQYAHYQPALVEPPNPETISIILDFDLFRQAEWNIEKDAEV